MVYRIAHPDEYLAITGAMVDTVKITKSAWVWPLQRVLPPPLYLLELN
jgi:flotillin